jgi:hypothetical protein
MHLFAKADGEAADATGKAGDAQKGTTQAWEDGAEAAGDLGEEVKTLGEELGDLNENYLDNREAGRAVRDSLRDIREALKAYRKEHGSLQGAFKQGTKSGDDFMGMLDGLAKDYVTQIETVERVSGSEKRVQAVYDRSRRKLIEVATQLGMTRREAKDYADQVLGTPDMVKTHFQTEGLETSMDRLSTYKRYLDNLPPLVQTTIQTNRIYNNERRLDHANGGIVQAFAGGGFTQQGQYVARVPQLRRGGNILWAEPETGWEAYISGKPGMEARNREVWLEAGRRLGMVPAALQQAFTGGRSFDRGGFAGGGLATLARQIARSTTPGPGPIVGRFTITNWQTGEGYMRQIARDELADDDAYTTSRGRMNR